ncbi:hypothetical protein ACWAUB_12615 [Bradyrhizobium guangdongense]
MVATNVPVYTSRMILPLGARVLGLIKSDAVLNPIIGRETSRVVSEDQRMYLANKISVSAEMAQGSGLYNVSALGRTPQEAQDILQRILDQVLKLSRPSGAWRDKILAEIELLKRSIDESKKLSAKLNDNLEHVTTGSEGEVYARAFVFLLSDIRQQEHRLLDLDESLQGLREEDIVVRPTLAVTPEPQGLWRKLILVWGGALVLMCLVAVATMGYRPGVGEGGAGL